MHPGGRHFHCAVLSLIPFEKVTKGESVVTGIAVPEPFRLL